MIVADRMILAPSLSEAWADALAYLLESAPEQRAVNLNIRIEEPTKEEPHIRAFADRLLADLKMQDAATVANTIFPAEWGLDLPEPAELAADYRDHYPMIKSMGNSGGTYFGRLVAYPDRETGGTIDQLTTTVEKLRKGKKTGPFYRSIYEFNIYSAGHDRNKRRGFPCLAHVGLHLDGEDRLHATALYRSHDVVEKGYGNYLGLGGLLAYVARASDLNFGELEVIAGGSFFGAPLRSVRAKRDELFALLDRPSPHRGG
jgi:thymidylate synthase